MLTIGRLVHRLAAWSVVPLALLAIPLSAQSSASARLAGRVPPSIQAELARLVDSARTAGLPSEALVQKALEGATKRAEPRRIVSVVRVLAAELDAARRALGPDASEAEIVAGASALHAGVPAPTLARLRKDRPRQPLTIALGVMSELIARGVSTEQATRTVVALVERGARDEVLTGFGEAVERDIAQGAPPSVATAIRGDALTSGAAGPTSVSGGDRQATPPVPRAPRKP